MKQNKITFRALGENCGKKNAKKKEPVGWGSIVLAQKIVRKITFGIFLRPAAVCAAAARRVQKYTLHLL